MINKYAALEAKVLMRAHTQMLFNWTAAEGAFVITEELREALKTSCARIYEIIDAIPGVNNAKKNCKGNILNG